MKRKAIRVLSLIMVFCMVLPFAGCGPAAVNNAANNSSVAAPVNAEENSAGRTTFEDTKSIEVDIPEGRGGVAISGPVQGAAGVNNQQLIQNGQNSQNDAGKNSSKNTVENEGMPKQLTIEDIQAMNSSTVVDIYSNNGYLSTLVGKFYDKKVNNIEDAIDSIKGLAALLGLTKGCEFFAVYAEKDNDGYTYYTLQQRYGGLTLQYSTMRIVIDPEGYTAGLTSSFQPNVGTAPAEDAISKTEAENVVKQKYASLGLRYFEDHTLRLAATFNNVVYNCWVVYTDNPDASAAFDMPYVEHYIASSDGTYLTAIPANTFASSNMDIMNTDGYFEGLTVQNVSKTVKMADGSSRTVTVPVSKNSRDGKYYLIDPGRKIAVAQYRDFYYSGIVNMVSSSTPDGWTDNNILAYDNYIKAYDFYDERGIHSVDGFNVPILVTVGYCDQQGNPVDNACFYGINQGWACFAVSDANRYSDCLDVVAHEFTHGVTRSSMQGTAYRNETGSINESYSDIMGNLCEMISGETTDRSWLIAENSGAVMRDMGDPNKYSQPAYVGDAYYVPTVLTPDVNYNDNGGVHVNNSLIGHMAYLLDKAGMTMDEQFSMWATSIELLTPLSDYMDLHGILLFSLKINGMLQEYGMTLNKAFADAGLNDNWDTSYLTATKEGYGRVQFSTDGYIAGLASMVLFATSNGNVVSSTYPDKNGVVSTLLPQGEYIAQLQISEENQASAYNFTGNSWSGGAQFAAFSITAGKTTTIASVNSGKAVSTGSSGGQQPQPQPQPSQAGLTLSTYNGGYFSMLIPQGWKVDVSGAFAGICYKVYDPANPARQFFFYGALAPYHKSEAARRALSPYDYTGMISNGPVLTEASVKGQTDCWQYCINYQNRYEGRSIFTTLNNINMVARVGFQGPYAAYSGASETVGAAVCSTETGTQCILLIASSLVDTDIYNYMGGNWYYTAFNTCGVLCPYGEFDAMYQDMLQCLGSLQFTEDYIKMSQSSSLPLAENGLITYNFGLITGAMDSLYQQVK